MLRNTTNASDSTPSGVVIRNYPRGLCRLRTSNLDGSMFYSVSFKFKDAWASFIIPEDSVQQSMRHNGSVIPDRVNIMLGPSEDIRKVSIRTDGRYASQPMFNSTIYSSVVADRNNYLRSIAV